MDAIRRTIRFLLLGMAVVALSVGYRILWDKKGKGLLAVNSADADIVSGSGTGEGTGGAGGCGNESCSASGGYFREAEDVSAEKLV